LAQANLPTRWRNIIIAHPELVKPSEILVAMILYKHMDNVTGRCYPSILTIAEESRLTDRTVRTALNKLVSLGLIIRHREKYKNASFSHYVYFPRIPAEMITAINEKQVEIKTSKLETSEPNQRKSLPPNYPYNYPYNYDNNVSKQEILEQKQLDPHEKTITIYDRGRELIIGESQVKTKKDCLYILKNIQNGTYQEKVINWFIENNLSEIKTRDDLISFKRLPDTNTAESL